MIIYKVTNKVNGKIYIGQSINPIEERWRRHLNDAFHYIKDTHFARAIRYYGADNFEYEVIDTADDQDELTTKEYYWIDFYNAGENGYNENTDGYKCGGNTYRAKTPEEMKAIKEKIRQSKLGGKNPNATGVKCKNVNTNEEYHFESQSEMQAFFGESNHQFCSRRCLGSIKCLYKNEWLIAYENADYPTDYTLKGQTKKRGIEIKITDRKTNEVFYFASIRDAKLNATISLPDRKTISLIIKGLQEQPKNCIIELAN